MPNPRGGVLFQKVPGLASRGLHWRQLLLVYVLAVGLLAGSAYTMYVHYDFSHSLDTRSYLSMARGEFRGVSITRRYRVPVPAVAGAVAWPVEQVYARIWPQRAATDWPLRLAFYLVNTLVLAGAGLLIFRSCVLYGASPPAALLALVAVLTSRWAVYTAGLPLVDSLYLLVFALAFYAARSGSAAALVACILLGPHAKESFIFLAPWLLWFARPALSWPRQLGWLALSGALAYAVRHWIDTQVGAPPQESLNNALDHLHNITYSLRRLLSVKGAGEIFSIFGFFWLVLLAGWRFSSQLWLRPLGLGGLALLGVILVHMLLSGDLGRMGYLASPVFAVVFALLLTHHPALQWLGGTAAETEPPKPVA
ncbi:hypothetical protein [Hymenobacter cellulosivorans]|uniref:Glycosyltransferase RgtA/B/C/D-like domain-containing protein n=1 Tax=Hymenobacter cellulosivorans TaxID=2932249 RepID=A0ABY4FDC6_9BACT|nr:hypothetical protein [Hymenobacter cellulosivorans]UOQ54682.1 hypothetical protein MUN80_07975 [Hymenobacter cellulosivorans]